jgi:hypothetical protein
LIGWAGRAWDLQELTPDELPVEAQSALKGLGAITETMLRLQQSADKASASNDKASGRMWWLMVRFRRERMRPL